MNLEKNWTLDLGLNNYFYAYIKDKIIKYTKQSRAHSGADRHTRFFFSLLSLFINSIFRPAVDSPEFHFPAKTIPSNPIIIRSLINIYRNNLHYSMPISLCMARCFSLILLIFTIHKVTRTQNSNSHSQVRTYNIHFYIYSVKMTVYDATFVNRELSKRTSIFGLHLWAVIGIVVGAVIVLILFLFSLCITASRRRSSKHKLYRPAKLSGAKEHTPVISKEIQEIVHDAAPDHRPIVPQARFIYTFRLHLKFQNLIFTGTNQINLFYFYNEFVDGKLSFNAVGASEILFGSFSAVYVLFITGKSSMLR